MPGTEEFQDILNPDQYCYFVVIGDDEWVENLNTLADKVARAEPDWRRTHRIRNKEDVISHLQNLSSSVTEYHQLLEKDSGFGFSISINRKVCDVITRNTVPLDVLRVMKSFQKAEIG